MCNSRKEILNQYITYILTIYITEVDRSTINLYFKHVPKLRIKYHTIKMLFPKLHTKISNKVKVTRIPLFPLTEFSTPCGGYGPRSGTTCRRVLKFFVVVRP